MNFDAKRIDFKVKIRARDNVICDISGFICIVKKCEHERRNPRNAREKSSLCSDEIKSVFQPDEVGYRPKDFTRRRRNYTVCQDGFN